MTKTECGICGGSASLVSEEREVFIGKRGVVVVDEFFLCDDCGEELYEPGQMDAVMRRASDAIRGTMGLLLPAEIQAVRDSLELSQAKFEKMLRVGAKTVVRWEKGTVFQNQATDVLIRAVRDFPGFAEYLAEAAEIGLPKRERRVIAAKPFLKFELGEDELVGDDGYVLPDAQYYPVATGGVATGGRERSAA